MIQKLLDGLEGVLEGTADYEQRLSLLVNAHTLLSDNLITPRVPEQFFVPMVRSLEAMVGSERGGGPGADSTIEMATWFIRDAKRVMANLTRDSVLSHWHEDRG